MTNTPDHNPNHHVSLAVEALGSARVVAAESEEIGILKRREIEAKIIAPIYQILKREIGEERAKAVIAEAVVEDARKNGKEFAAREPNGPSMKTFIDLQDLWEKDDALETDVLEANEDRYHYNVTRCRYAEMYKELGLAEIGHLLSCRRDYEFPTAYDPNISLERTTTIMEGHAVCDFRYTYNH